jgi:hypothetical protein
MEDTDFSDAPPRSPKLVLGVAIAGVVLCPFLGPVAVYMADAERKRAVVDGEQPEQLLMIARVLGYVGTAVLCLDLIGLMIGAILLAMGAGS